jgi:hypothetical protein
VYLPCYRVQQPDEAGFCDAAFEERVCSQGAEGIIADFRIRGGTAAMDEREVFVGREGRNIEQDQP